MNELSLFDEVAEKTVTTKELAESIGVDVRTIQLAVQRLGLAKVLSQVKIRGKEAFIYNEEQATLIKQEIQGHHNLASRQIDSVSTDYEMELLTQKVINYHVQKAAEYKQRAEIAEQKLLEQKPMVDGYQTFLESHSTFSMQEASAMLKDKNGRAAYGRQKLINKLRSEGILLPRPSPAIPYREYIERGYFEVKTTVVNGVSRESALVFPKGMDYIAKKLGLIVEYEAA